MEPQPSDEWDYLRREGDDPDEDADRGAEELALHLDEPDARPSQDPGRSDDGVRVVGDDEPVEDHFDDEESERPPSAATPEHEPDLEEILESQHYAFAEEHGADDPG